MLDETLLELSLGAGSALEDTKNVVPLSCRKIVDCVDRARSNAMRPDQLAKRKVVDEFTQFLIGQLSVNSHSPLYSFRSSEKAPSNTVSYLELFVLNA